jgi:hypothetical protein
MFTIRSSRQDGFMAYFHRLTLIGVFALAAAGCGDDTTSGGADMNVAADMTVCGGGSVAGAQDNHCFDDGGAEFLTVDPAMCTVDAGMDTGGGDDFGDTMFNTSGNDDDCKYAVSYSITGGGICVGADTFFVVTLKDATTNSLVGGASAVRPEVFMTSSGAPVNTSASTTTETSTGVYKIGPIKFTSAGNYTVRFHFYEDCTDTPTSPHGHAAFFVNVP